MLLRDFVNKKIASADKEASVEGVPLTLNNCKKYKNMRDLKVYGNCFQDGTPSPENPIAVQCVGELVTDETDINYGKYKVTIVQRGKNLCTPKMPISANNCTYENGVVTQKTADTNTAPYFKISSVDTNGSLITLNSWYGSLGKRTGAKFTLQYDNQYLLFGLNGSKIDTTIELQRLPKGTYMVSFKLLNDVQGSYSWCDMEIEEFKKDVTPTEYEPYVEPIRTNLYLDEPLRKHGTYADCIDGKNDKVVRNMGLVVFTDNLSMAEWGSTEEVLQVTTSMCDKFKQSSKVMCNYFMNGSAATKEKNTVVVSTGISRTYFRFDKSQIATIDDAVSWFKSKYDAGNPVVVIGQLATPIEEPLNIELPKLNAKTTIIEVDTSLLPGNISGKYIIR